MNQYLATENEQEVSLEALRRSAAKGQGDPLMDLMKSTAERLERLAFELRTNTQSERAVAPQTAPHRD